MFCNRKLSFPWNAEDDNNGDNNNKSRANVILNNIDEKRCLAARENICHHRQLGSLHQIISSNSSETINGHKMPSSFVFTSSASALKFRHNSNQRKSSSRKMCDWLACLYKVRMHYFV